MLVYKFGGASVKNAQGIKRLAKLVEQAPRPLVIIVSAMGKTTDALERVVNSFYKHDSNTVELIGIVEKFHWDIITELFPANHPVYPQIKNLFQELYQSVKRQPSMNYDYEYDRIVSFGELLSTTIVSNYLDFSGIKNQWLDVRNYIKTDSNYRDANVNWDLTLYKIKTLNFDPHTIYLTQGFIASDSNNSVTTLGREGSDFTGAIFAWALGAESLTVWKDVNGIFNADPKMFDDARSFQKLSYRETIELAFYGAKVIHPKTIRPLSEKQIPLHVRSFMNPQENGTVIHNFDRDQEPQMPVIIVKKNQILISVSDIKYNFIGEGGLHQIFSALDRHNVKANVMQRSALQFSFSVDNDPLRIKNLMNDLKRNFKVKYNENLTLFTIRHYDQQTIKKVTAGKKIYLHQQSRTMSFYLVKEETV